MKRAYFGCKAYSMYLSPRFLLLRSSCASLASSAVSYSANASPVDFSARTPSSYLPDFINMPDVIKAKISEKAEPSYS